MADEQKVEIEYDSNDESARQAAEKFGNIFASVIAKHAPSIGRDFGREFVKGMAAEQQAQKISKPLVDGFERATDAAGKAGTRAGAEYAARYAKAAGGGPGLKNAIARGQSTTGGEGFFEGAAAGAKKANSEFKRAADAVGETTAAAKQLDDEMGALLKSTQAVKKTLLAGGQDENLFASVDEQVRRLIQLQERLRNFDGDATGFRKITVEAANLRVGLAKQVQEIGVVLGQLSKRMAEEARVQYGIQRNANALQETAARERRGVAVTTLQTESAESVAILKSSTQKQIQAAQSASRARIELARFTFRQIQFFEQQIAKAVGATGRVLSGIATGAAAGLARLGNAFRRADTGLNDNLQGALLQRERAIDGSFDRQERRVRQSAVEQSAVLNSLQAQTSTGLAGLASGRSQLGALLGGGAAIGGGFLLVNKLRAGFNEAVNLQESLNLVREVFDGAANDIIAFSETSVDALFQTQSAALSVAGDFGTFGKAANKSGKDLTDFTITLSTLATDLASFRNTSVQDATTAISAALRGEAEPIRRYGVLLNEQTLQQRALNEGIIDTIRVLQPAERIQAAYAEILAQTGDAQGDAARTADQFANSLKRTQAQSVQTFADITRGLVPFGEFVLNVVFPALGGLSALITDDLSPAMSTFRTALIGASIAIGGLLIAKAAGEALQFLAIGLRAALTPLGLLVVSFAALGATLAILRETNPAVRAALDGFRELASERITTGLQLLGEGIGRLGDILTQRALPAFIQIARQAANILAPALNLAASIVVGVIIPAFTLLASFLTNTVIPSLISVGNLFVTNIVPALRTFGSVAESVLGFILPILEPTIRGFLALGDAIAETFRTGDFGNLLGGLSGLATGIGETFTIIGQGIYNALRPQVERAVNFIFEYFNSVDWERVGISILGAVETVGLVLGTIVTHPYFIRAIAAIVAAAVVLGGAFLKGFAEGVASNLPQLASDLGNLLQFGFEQAVKEIGYTGIAGLIVAGILAKLLIGNLFASFSRVGEQAGGSFAKGFAKNTASFAGTVFGGSRGFFGPAAVEQARRAGDDQARAYRQAFDRANRDLVALGGSRVAQRTDTKGNLAPISTSDVSKVNRELQNLSNNLGTARSRALLLRDSIGSIYSAAIPKATRGSEAFGRAISQSFSRIDFARLGQSAGIAVLGSFGAVMAGKDGLSKGGVAGILAAAIGAGLAANSVPVAAAVAGVGLIAAGIRELKGDSEEAAAAIAAMAESWLNLDSMERALDLQRDILKEALDAGTGVQAVAALLPADFGSNFAKDATTSSVTAQDAFTRLAEGIKLDTNKIDGYLTAFGDDLSIIENADALLNPRSREQNLAIGGQTAALQRFVDDLTAAGVTAEGFYGILDILTRNVATSTGALTSLGNTVSLASDALDNSVLADLNPQAQNAAEGINILTGAYGPLTKAQKELVRIQEQNATTSLFESVSAQVAQAGGSAIDLFELVKAAAAQANISIDFGWLQRLIDGWGAAEDAVLSYAGEAARLGKIYPELPKLDLQAITNYNEKVLELDNRLFDLQKSSNLAAVGIQELERQRTERIRGQIDNVTKALSKASEAAQQAEKDLTKFITGKYLDTPQASLDKVITSVPGVGDAIEEAQAVGGIQGDALLRQAIGSFDAGVADFVRTAVEAGWSPDMIREALGPVFAAFDEEMMKGGNSIRSLDFTEGIKLPTRDMLNANLAGIAGDSGLDVAVQTLINSRAEEARLNNQLDRLNLEAESDVIFDTQQVRDALAAAGLDTEFLVDITPEAVRGAQQLSDAVNQVAEFEAAVLQIIRDAANLPDRPTGDDNNPVLTPTVNVYFNDELVATVAPDSPGNTISGLRVRAGGNMVPV